MKNAVLYIHGKGGNAAEAEHYKPFFEGWELYGLDYSGNTPWDTKGEIQAAFDALAEKHSRIVLIANSIGAYFSMNALGERRPERAFFISPIVDMERLIGDMMRWAGVSEARLREEKEIDTTFGERLSWQYLSYVRENPISWPVKTDILYGEKDNLTALETVSAFARKTGASLTVMEGGEHWFHTPEQMEFQDAWLKGLLCQA